MEWILVLLVIIVLLVIAVPRLMKMMADRQMQAEAESVRQMTSAAGDPLLVDLDSDRSILLYFRADWCGPCRTTQSPIIENLLDEFGDSIQLKKIDVDKDPEAAERWKVEALPRTVILRPGMTVHAANIGVATAETLRNQIATAQKADASTPPVVEREKVEMGAGSGFSFKFIDRDKE
jgi:thioredoxin 1